LTYPGAVIVADAPNAADWMQAWGSIAAVLTSTIAIVITGLLLRHEVRARREEQGEARQSQARLVVVENAQRRGKYFFHRAKVFNHSAGPIYHVTISLPELPDPDNPPPPGGWPDPNAPPHGGEPEEVLMSGEGEAGYHAHLPPGQSAIVSVFENRPEDFLRWSVMFDAYFVAFVDAQGRRWCAGPGGRLSYREPYFVPDPERASGAPSLIWHEVRGVDLPNAS